MKSLYSTTVAFVAIFMIVPLVHAAPSFPSWSEKLGPNKRFTVLTAFNSEAVVDNETGLVWEQSPSQHRMTWNDAQLHCNQMKAGNRFGWRLPTIQEFASLVDPATPDDLPPGHPFSNAPQDYSWSATSDAIDNSFAWWVNLGFHASPPMGNGLGKANSAYAWCVRGGQGVDPQ